MTVVCCALAAAVAWCALIVSGNTGAAAALSEATAGPGAVTFGPAYVAVPGTPAPVGSGLDAIAANPAGTLLAAVDPGAGVVEADGVDVHLERQRQRREVT